MICVVCKYKNQNTGSCKLRQRRYCGEDAVHFAKRMGVIVNNITNDSHNVHHEWPNKYNPKDVIECNHFTEIS